MEKEREQGTSFLAPKDTALQVSYQTHNLERRTARQRNEEKELSQFKDWPTMRQDGWGQVLRVSQEGRDYENA